MQATALAATISGLDAHLVRVEVDSGRGVPMFHIVGLPEASVRESRMRVRAALGRLGVDLGEWVLTVNLAPADLRKSGGAFDLAIACAVLAALGRVRPEALAGVLLLGELSLTGALRPVRGVLPAMLGARRQGLASAVVPPGNAAEAAVVGDVDARVGSELTAVVDHLNGGTSLERARPAPSAARVALEGDLADVRGQQAARRALEIAAAGGHNLLMIGPPGSGKTMLARRLPGILPPLGLAESLEVTAIHSVAGLLAPGQGLVCERPFRAPHHTVSAAGLLGGGDPLRPGEVSLAHHGCLFLDELCEFQRHVLEGLRQPLETGELVICRARSRGVFPARPLLDAAVNPCPCGYLGHPTRRCDCSPTRIAAYAGRLSGPLLDRIDLQVVLPPVAVDELHAKGPAESSAAVAARVVAARARQEERRARGLVACRRNAELGSAEALCVAPPDEATRRLLRAAAERCGLSARGYVKVQRIARTLADLEGLDVPGPPHFAEALQHRHLDARAGAPPSRASA
ncbi:MAG: YifB family Mg chelatase-like AAA ATPase [Myxococcales bacterium]|nr:YifB family Mg chelatase-like AAA ATPase [Myxococcales bacterium]